MTSILTADENGPWSGDGSKGGGGKDGDGAGPRNPWSVPPSGKRGPAQPSALDDLIARARSVRGGGSGGGSGGGGRPDRRSLWAIGAGVVLAAWLLVTSFHAIGPRQRGVVTMLGAYAGTLDPGFRLTLPAPFAAVRTVDVQSIRTDSFPKGEGENLMLTADQNVVDLAYLVQWTVADPQQFVFQLRHPEETVRDAAESAMRAVLATTSFQQAIGGGRSVVEAKVADATQRILDGYRAGIRIQGVSVRQASAPARTNEAFNAVTVAQRESDANLSSAEGYARAVVARAEGDAAAFDKVYAQYRLAPEVTRRRMYYETMEAVLARSDKTIIEPGVTPLMALPGAKTLVPPAQANPAPQGAGQ